MLTKNQIAEALAAKGIANARLVKSVLDGVSELAAEELAKGENFSVPGLVKFVWKFTPAKKKGESYKKGETYTGFGGVEQTAEQDSPARKQKIRLAIGGATPINRVKKDASAQRKAINKAKK